ncbi:MAG: tetratricopeptide repeat protein [candidate division Zixibacteria bacterium]|nr:tetratricopeptide repeat protein [candidate division Zixibacteria bacterium]
MKTWPKLFVAYLVCAAALGSGCAKRGREGITWLKSMDEGKEQASAEGKNLVAYYSADWSKMSDKFEDEVLANAEVEKKLAPFVAVRIDEETDEETPKAYGVSAFPTTIFYDARGDELKRVVGAVTAEEFIKLLDDVAAGRVETLKDLLAREKANPDDLKLAYKLGTTYVETGRYEKARPRLEKLVTQDPKNETSLCPSALTQLGFIDLTAHQANEALAFFNDVIAKYPEAPETRKCHLYAGDAHQLLENVDDAVAAYRKVVADYPGTPEAEEAQRKLTQLTMFEETVKAFTQGPRPGETE